MFTREDEIKNVRENGVHVIILGAGASIASTMRNPEKNERVLPSMANIIQVLGLEKLIEPIPVDIRKFDNDFEKFYSKLYDRPELNDTRFKIEKRIFDYFNKLLLPDTPTIYDYLVLSLRPKDVIATFNWDPFLYQAYDRISKYTKPAGILFLHGNAAIGYSSVSGIAGPSNHYDGITGEFLKPTQLFFPVEQKDYNSDEFIKGQWEELSLHLKVAERITIFGYSAPKSDIEAMSLLNESWGGYELRHMEQFEIVDVQDEKIVKESWHEFIHTHHYKYITDFFNSSIAYHPRRTIEDFYRMVLPMNSGNMFREGNKVPDNFKSLDDMWDWYKILIQAE